MNCLFLLLLLCCCSNKNNNWNCEDSCKNQYNNYRHHHHEECEWRNNFYNVASDNDCECDRRRDNDKKCDNDIEPRIFPPYHNDNCGCND